MNTFTEFKDVPLGFFLKRAFHESSGGYVFHLCVKVNDGDWFDQPSCPAYSDKASGPTCAEFWKWAKQNMPIYHYPSVVKSATL